MTHAMITVLTIIFALHGSMTAAETVFMEEDNSLILYTDRFEWAGSISDPQASSGIYRFSNIDGNYISLTYTFHSFTFNTPKWPRINFKVLVQVDGDTFEVDLQDKGKSPDGNIGPNLGPASLASGPVFRFDGGFMKTRVIKVFPAPRQPSDNLYVPLIVIDAFSFEVDDSFPRPTVVSPSPSPSRPATTTGGGVITTTVVGSGGTSIITTSIAPTSSPTSGTSSSSSSAQSPSSSPLATNSFSDASSSTVTPLPTSSALPNATLGLEHASSKLNIGLVAGLSVMGFLLLAVLMCLLWNRLRKRRRRGEGLNELEGPIPPEAARPYPHLEKTGGSNGGETDELPESVGSSEAFARKLRGWRPRYTLQTPPISPAVQRMGTGGANPLEHTPGNEKTEVQAPSNGTSPSNVSTSQAMSPDIAPPQFQTSLSTSMNDTRPLSMDLPPMYSPADPTRRTLILPQGQQMATTS